MVWTIEEFTDGFFKLIDHLELDRVSPHMGRVSSHMGVHC